MGRRLAVVAAEKYLQADDLMSEIVAADRVATEIDGAREDMFTAGACIAVARHALYGAALRFSAAVSPNVLPLNVRRSELTTTQLAQAVLDRPAA